MPRLTLVPMTILSRLAAPALIAGGIAAAALLWPAGASGGGSLHVGDIDATATRKAAWQAKVTVTVHDASDKPIAGANVGAAWGEGAAGTGRCKTGRQGTCTMTSPTVAAGTTQVTLRIMGVSAPGYVYDAAANHDGDGSSDGMTIIVNK